MPTPWDIERRRSFRASPPQKRNRYTPDHMLFQLEPSHEILKPDAAAWIMDLIHIIDGDIETGRKGGLKFGTEGGSGLVVDLDSGIAKLRNVTTSKDDADQALQNEKPPTPNNAYHSISALANGGKPARDWETIMRIQKLEIYDLGGHATPAFEEQLAEKPRLRTPSPRSQRTQVSKGGAAAAEKRSEPRVGKEELKKRIEGFGPSGRGGDMHYREENVEL